METKDILKELRKRKGYSTMQEFCSEASINFSTYQNYETGKRLPTAEILMKLADFYGVSVDCLLGREPVPDPFKEMKLSEETEQKVIEKYMSLPENVRASVLDMIRQLGGVVDTREITETTEAGTLHDQLTDAEAEKTAG